MRTLSEFFGFLVKEDASMFHDDEAEERFDIKTLKSIRSHRELWMYVERTLGRPFAGGNFRHTWDLGNGKVLKIIIDPTKTYQNRNEVRNTKCLGTSYAPKIFAFDKANFFWMRLVSFC
jgi:hypothetical protein